MMAAGDRDAQGPGRPEGLRSKGAHRPLLGIDAIGHIRMAR